MFQNDQKNQISIKIGDFGNSKQSIGYLNSYEVGAPFYQSPELLNNESYTAKTDVW